MCEKKKCNEGGEVKNLPFTKVATSLNEVREKKWHIHMFCLTRSTEFSSIVFY